MFTLGTVVSASWIPWLVCGAAVGYGAASGVYGKDSPAMAYPQGTSRRQDAVRGVDGGPERAAATQNDHDPTSVRL